MSRSEESTRRYDHQRRQRAPWRKWYSSPRWRARRALQLAEQPLCVYCRREGRSRFATVANHKIPHRGDPKLFWEGELESACKECHDGRVQRIEIHGYDKALDDDGFPADPDHPFNRSDRSRAKPKKE